MGQTDEERYQEQAKAAGVDLPELEETAPAATPHEEPAVEPKAQEPKEPEAPAPAPKVPETEQGKEKEPLQEQNPQEQQPQRKRSIYDDYKDKKDQLKEKDTLLQQAERERDEWRSKFEAVKTAETPEEKKEATDELEAFAKEINADPDQLRKMRELFLKGAPSAPSGISKEEFDEWKTWKTQNQQTIEKSMFNDEFQSSLPALKELFPKMSEGDTDAMKARLDELSHTKENFDKPLDYVAFAHRKELSALITPKKRGMESKGRESVEETTPGFDPSADLSTMTPAQRQEWETEYRKMSKSDGIFTGENGKKTIL